MTKQLTMGVCIGLTIAGAIGYTVNFINSNRNVSKELVVSKNIEGCTDPVILTHIASLDQTPQKWKSDGYYAYMPVGEEQSGFFPWSTRTTYSGLWIANSDYRLDLALGYEIFNRPSMTNIKYSMSDECRQALHKSVSKWKTYYVRKMLSGE